MYKIFTIILFVCFCAKANAVEKRLIDVEKKYLLNFVKYVKWPSNSPEIKRICVFEGDPMAAELLNDDNVITKFALETMSSLSSIDNCHVIYVSDYSDENVEYILSITKGKTILTISNTKNFAKLGGIIYFKVNSAKKPVLRLNKSSLKNNKLGLNGDLLSIMEIVH